MTDIDELEPESGSSGLARALKIAAAAAAVGAAAGAARAFTARNGHDHDDEPHDGDEPDEQDADEGPTDEAEPEPEAERDGDDAGDEEEPPLPAAQQDEESESEPPDNEPEPEPVAGGTFDQTAEVVRRAREQLTALRGSEPESVSELTRTHDGWTVTFEVVEVARIPETTDVMASYALVLDDDANLVHYARIRRYSRSQAEQEDGV